MFTALAISPGIMGKFPFNTDAPALRHVFLHCLGVLASDNAVKEIRFIFPLIPLFNGFVDTD
jgi:hypothetical protein